MLQGEGLDVRRSWSQPAAERSDSDVLRDSAWVWDTPLWMTPMPLVAAIKGGCGSVPPGRSCSGDGASRKGR